MKLILWNGSRSRISLAMGLSARGALGAHSVSFKRDEELRFLSSEV